MSSTKYGFAANKIKIGINERVKFDFKVIS